MQSVHFLFQGENTEYGLPSFVWTLPGGHYIAIVEKTNGDLVLLGAFHHRNVAPKFVHLVLDVRRQLASVPLGAEIKDHIADTDALSFVGVNHKRNIQFVELLLERCQCPQDEIDPSRASIVRPVVRRSNHEQCDHVASLALLPSGLGKAGCMGKRSVVMDSEVMHPHPVDDVFPIGRVVAFRRGVVFQSSFKLLERSSVVTASLGGRVEVRSVPSITRLGVGSSTIRRLDLGTPGDDCRASIGFRGGGSGRSLLLALGGRFRRLGFILVGMLGKFGVERLFLLVCLMLGGRGGGFAF